MCRLSFPIIIISLLLFFTSSCNATLEKKAVQRRLIHFSSIGNNTAIKETIDEGIDINNYDENGSTALIQAAANGHIKTVRFLVNKGAYVNAQEGLKGFNRMSKGIYTGSLKLLSFFDRFAEENINNNQGLSALAFLAFKFLVNTTQYALGEKDKKKRAVIYGNTALISASAAGNIDIVKFLLENGADVNIKREDGNSALLIAAVNGNNEMVKLLIQYGADMNAMNKEGQTAYMIATDYAHKDVADILRLYGAVKTAKDTEDNRNSLGNTIASAAKTIFQVIHGGTSTY